MFKPHKLLTAEERSKAMSNLRKHKTVAKHIRLAWACKDGAESRVHSEKAQKYASRYGIPLKLVASV